VINDACWLPWIWDQIVLFWAPCAEWLGW
jgi:hypothetical protein